MNGSFMFLKEIAVSVISQDQPYEVPDFSA